MISHSPPTWMQISQRFEERMQNYACKEARPRGAWEPVEEKAEEDSGRDERVAQYFAYGGPGRALRLR